MCILFDGTSVHKPCCSEVHPNCQASVYQWLLNVPKIQRSVISIARLSHWFSQQPSIPVVCGQGYREGSPTIEATLSSLVVKCDLISINCKSLPQLFSLMLHKNASDKFSFENCKFTIQRSKESTGRWGANWNNSIEIFPQALECKLNYKR